MFSIVISTNSKRDITFETLTTLILAQHISLTLLHSTSLWACVE